MRIFPVWLEAETIILVAELFEDILKLAVNSKYINAQRTLGWVLKEVQDFLSKLYPFRLQPINFGLSEQEKEVIALRIKNNEKSWMRITWEIILGFISKSLDLEEGQPQIK